MHGIFIWHILFNRIFVKANYHKRMQDDVLFDTVCQSRKKLYIPRRLFVPRFLPSAQLRHPAFQILKYRSKFVNARTVCEFSFLFLLYKVIKPWFRWGERNLFLKAPRSGYWLTKEFVRYRQRNPYLQYLLYSVGERWVYFSSTVAYLISRV